MAAPTGYENWNKLQSIKVYDARHEKTDHKIFVVVIPSELYH